MIDNRPIVADTSADRRPLSAPVDERREENWRGEAQGLYSAWNSWGERSPFALGATGRW